MRVGAVTISNIKARKRAREISLQALYSWQLTNEEPTVIKNNYLEIHSEKNFDAAYFDYLFSNIAADTNPLDTSFAEFISRPISEMTNIELAILRIGTYELLNCHEIPFKVIINEAVDLAKNFGATDGHKFINGVLDKLAKQIRAKEF